MKKLLVVFTIVFANTAFCAEWYPYSGTSHGYLYVDLGLSVNWATKNLGAGVPSEYGNFFSWGDGLYTKDEYSWSTYRLCNQTWKSMMKYCFSSEYGTVDSISVLEMENDPVWLNIHFGTKDTVWRSPTIEEWKELLDTNNCKWTATSMNGKKGYKVTSKKFGYTNNWIFLPFTGTYNGSIHYEPDTVGLYWSSTVYQTMSNNAFCAYIGYGMYTTSIYFRYYGFPVRGVFTNQANRKDVIIYHGSEKLYETQSESLGGLHPKAFNHKIKSHTFENGIGTIIFEGEIDTIGKKAFYKCNNVSQIHLPNSVTYIGDNAFGGCYLLDSINIPQGVNYIGENAFSSCYPLRTIDIPEGIDSLRNNTFSACTTLVEIVIPKSVKYLGDNLFSGCTNIDTVIFKSSNILEHIGAGSFAYCSKIKHISLPYSVNYIGDGAFVGCSLMEDIAIPNNVSYIGVRAFRDCHHLVSINLPYNIDSIASETFMYCTRLESMTIPSNVYRIGDDAFYSCTNLTSIDIPNSVTSIGRFAFNCCSLLVDLNIPEHLEYISDGTFFGCKGIKYLSLPNSIKSIGWSSFSNCMGLDSIALSDSLTTIGESAFSSCSSLLRINFPASLTNIGLGAFAWDTYLSSITCDAITPPSLGLVVFQEVNKQIPLYVPEESINAYKAADQWKDFLVQAKKPQTSIEEICAPSYHTSVKVIDNNLMYIVIDGNKYTITGTPIQ